jgi:hypothetical protein
MIEYISKEQVHLGLWQRFILRVLGEVYVGMEQPPGYSAPVPMYVVRCNVHGFFKTAPHGYSEKLTCTKCVDEGLIRVGLKRRHLMYVVIKQHGPFEGSSVHALCTTEESAERIKTELLSNRYGPSPPLDILSVEVDKAYPFSIEVEEQEEKTVHDVST